VKDRLGNCPKWERCSKYYDWLITLIDC
jgi:hypothetical protein